VAASWTLGRRGRRLRLLPTVRDHLSLYVGKEPGALLFTGVKGGPLRRSNFNKLSGWQHVVRVIGAPGLHFQ